METKYKQDYETKYSKWFKSYYVVWKRDECVYLSREFFLFKSYYVVWKRRGDLVFFDSNIGLNRTMQYGN